MLFADHRLPTKISCKEKPAYYEHQPVDFFEVAHNAWCSGARVSSKFSSSKADLVYNVTLGSNRVCADVSLRCLRSPLRSGELVRLSSLGATSIWLPATICGDSSTGHYSVKLAPESTGGVERVLTGVPARHLHHNFPEGVRVQVYRGSAKGWCRGIVVNPLDDALSPRVWFEVDSDMSNDDGADPPLPGLSSSAASSPRPSSPACSDAFRLDTAQHAITFPQTPRSCSPPPPRPSVQQPPTKALELHGVRKLLLEMRLEDLGADVEDDIQVRDIEDDESSPIQVGKAEPDGEVEEVAVRFGGEQQFEWVPHHLIRFGSGWLERQATLADSQPPEVAAAIAKGGSEPPSLFELSSDRLRRTTWI